jgi:hypothetical protein
MTTKKFLDISAVVLFVVIFTLMSAMLVFGVEIPTAQEARVKAMLGRDNIIAADTKKFAEEVQIGIADAIDRGALQVAITASGYDERAVHVINERLRLLGYVCKIEEAEPIGRTLDIISWGTK